jgi:hypothetical protein
VKKGNERILTVSVSLKKATGESGKAVPPTEATAARALEPLKAEETKSAPKPEPVKAALPPEEKPSLFKPAPNFDEPAPKKAKE